MIKIGNRQLCFSETFLISDNEDVNIDTEVDGWNLKITLTVIPSSDQKGSVSWEALSDSHAKIQFKGWNNINGITLQEPISIGTTDTTHKNVLFSACNYKIGTKNRFDFQLYIGDSHE